MKSTSTDYAAIIRAILPHIEEYIENSKSGKGKVLSQRKASNLGEDMGIDSWVKHGGIDADNVMQFLNPYLENSQHMHHPQYIGHQVNPAHLASGVADFISGVVNNPMAIYEMGPSSAVIEQAMINWMLDKAGWFRGKSIIDFEKYADNGGGILTHGGSMANLTALLGARAAKDPQAWDDGVNGNLVVMGPDVSHYSIARSISIMGIGKNNHIDIPTFDNEVMKVNALPSIYKSQVDSGKEVMCLIANACATSTGLYDPLDEIGDFCRAEGIWYHIDGAHGASALLSEKYRHLMKGIDKADSLIWDTHKMLRTTTLSAAVLFKDGINLHHNFQQKGSYLFHDKEKPGFDLMPYTIECTKSSIGTKLFWVLAAEGEEGLSNYIDRQYSITRAFYNLISSQDDFECPYIPESNILCFRYKGGLDTNEYQLQLRNELVKRGNFYITSTEVSGRRYLRLVVLNDTTDLSHIQDLIHELRSIASL